MSSSDFLSAMWQAFEDDIEEFDRKIAWYENYIWAAKRREETLVAEIEDAEHHKENLETKRARLVKDLERLAESDRVYDVTATTVVGISAFTSIDLTAG